MSRTGRENLSISPEMPSMARYFFDIHDGPHSSHDDEGEEIADLESVRLEAVRTIVQLGRDHIPSGTTDRLVIDVRDESGRAVLSVRLTLEVITP